jgi:hypothetical protein
MAARQTWSTIRACAPVCQPHAIHSALLTRNSQNPARRRHGRARPYPQREYQRRIHTNSPPPARVLSVAQVIIVADNRSRVSATVAAQVVRKTV